MARRKARRSGKIEPAVKTLMFVVPSGNSTVDLSQCASLVNRRFYRQGLNWAVAGFTFFTQPGSVGNIALAKIPDTWVASNAWEKGMRAWLKMNREALSEAESIKPKFLDFKVFMDSIHHTDGSAANLIPLDNLANNFTLGEWDYSSVQVPAAFDVEPVDGTITMREFDLIWTGASYPGVSPATGNDAVSLIEGYAASRGLPDILDPNAPADAADVAGGTPENWLSAIFNEGTTQDHELLEDMITENNQAPYPFENDGVHVDTQYPGGANNAPGLQPHDAMLVTATTIGGKTTAPGANFQCGLIRVLNGMDDLANITMLVHLVPGPHRGYMCQPQKDV
jgi:hypothetical protein